MSRSVLRLIIGAAVVALLLVFYASGSRNARRAESAGPGRDTRALKVQTTAPAVHSIDAGAFEPERR